MAATGGTDAAAILRLLSGGGAAGQDSRHPARHWPGRRSRLGRVFHDPFAGAVSLWDEAV